MINFWTWLFRGGARYPGIYRYWDFWLLLHAFIGGLLATTLPISLQQAATTLLLPVAGVFIGLSFAWGGNAQALLQTSEIEDVSNFSRGGYEEYVFAFQAAILCILITLVLWTLAGLGLFDKFWPTERELWPYRSIVGILFFFSSMTLRECWHVVLGAQNLLIMRFKVRQNSKKR
ncbi:hypothetical protein [Salinisphaera sp. Q1T1-3]|uniref:hypothetical protein n=1 Tax=Salinisphaera sp. Q1T1-3 TaxID=2321229 RepID=UPI0011C35597|nr:hypothetical protein [Salinisphaera sp. Q1T1-3]